MTFGNDKCKTSEMKEGKLSHNEGYILGNDEPIEAMEEDDTKLYLGKERNCIE